MSGNGAMEQSGNLKIGDLESQMEEGGRIAWRWRLLVLDCGTILTVVGLPVGAMKWVTQPATIDLQQCLSGELVINILSVCTGITMFRYVCGYSTTMEPVPDVPEGQDCGIWTRRDVANLAGEEI